MTHSYLRLSFGILNIFGLVLLSFVPWPTPPPIFIGLPSKILQLIAIFYKVEYVHMVWRWIRYEPVQAPSKDDKLPFISIVIPVFNESEFVRNSMKSIELSDYPKDRVELIVIDDGSTDDTWEHVNKAAGSVSASGITLRLLQHTVNQGKRKAIQTGFATALGSIIISLDSDSVVEKGALRNIVSPLMKDSSIGAVAGHLAVLNISSSSIFSFQSLLPRLLDIVFDHIGNLPRSALSAEGFVTILPGAFSAFRADAVQSHIDRLCTSTFLGAPLKHGEDMELAYRILCDGWRTVYQSNAVVHTMAPESLEKALLMFSRWERTNYTFLCMGYPALTVQKTLKLWLAMRPQRVQSPEFVDKEKQEDEPFITEEGTGSIYPFINVACIWLKGPLMLLVTYTLLRCVILYPRHALWILLEISILTVWRSFMLIPDALREKQTLYVSDVGGLKIYHTNGRLVWRLMLSWLAGMFQLGVLSWTSIFGIVTLKSQKWWTR